MLALKHEISIVVARGFDGQSVTYPASENEHRDGILAVSTVPSPNVSPALVARATEAARTIAAGLDYHGVLCVEFFVLEGDRLVVNEMAPRPHNSGHFSIDACVASQFEQQVRAMAGLPLGSTEVLAPSVMLNVLGDVWFTGTDAEGAAADAATGPAWAKVLAVPTAKLHLYGKTDARRARKMGHITCLGSTAAEASSAAAKVAGVLGIAFP
jgi:5-(carboxyamino)imidazole ribonucleotide synthase